MKKNDIILVGVLLVISLICITYMYAIKGIYDYESNGYTIHIEVKDHAAAFVQSPCPDHLCEHYGYLKDDGAMAVCLPAKATLSIRE